MLELLKVYYDQYHMLYQVHKTTLINNIGRFEESEFIAELSKIMLHLPLLLFSLLFFYFIVYCALNIFKLFNDSVMAMNKWSGSFATLRDAAWQAYVDFLRSLSPIIDSLMTFINIIKIVQIPAEMIIKRVMGLKARERFILLTELSKCIAKLFIWKLSGKRKLPEAFMPAPIDDYKRNVNINNSSPNNGRDDEMENESIAQAFSDIERLGGVEEYIGRHRMHPYVLCPELSIKPSQTLIEDLREISHIIRPVLFIGMYMAIEHWKPNSKWKWLAWITSLGLDAFDYSSIFIKNEKIISGKPSLIEREIEDYRLFNLVLHLFREPIYSTATRYHNILLIKINLSNFRFTIDSYRKWLDKLFITRPISGNSSSLTIRNYKNLSELVGKSLFLHFRLIIIIQIFILIIVQPWRIISLVKCLHFRVYSKSFDLLHLLKFIPILMSLSCYMTKDCGINLPKDWKCYSTMSLWLLQSFISSLLDS